MVYKVIRLGHPALRQKSKKVDLHRIHLARFQRFLDDLVQTMRAYSGVGIAAPQAGVPQRIFCVECRKNKRYPGMPSIPLYTVINPTVTILGASAANMFEGCLSIPDLRGYVPRARSVRLRGWDRTGKKIDIIAKGFHARIIQHEYDHLNGKVYLDRVKDKRSLSYVEYLDL